MTQFIEITNVFNVTDNAYTMAQSTREDTAPVMLAVAHIVTVQPVWNTDEIWTHTNISMSNGTTWKCSHLSDEIEAAMTSDHFCARVTS